MISSGSKIPTQYESAPSERRCVISGEGKVAIVTGGASGIGRAAALALARQGAWLAVADVDVDGGHATAQAIVAAGGAATFVRTDVSAAAEVSAMVDHTLATYGRLDCAFNNAGINDEHAPGADLDEALWDRTIAINLKGIWLCM
jgi:NAD(P)-dependent dehydrogenase (short-subunit alcohol dehydrogenase family)